MELNCAVRNSFLRNSDTGIAIAGARVVINGIREQTRRSERDDRHQQHRDYGFKQRETQFSRKVFVGLIRSNPRAQRAA